MSSYTWSHTTGLSLDRILIVGISSADGDGSNNAISLGDASVTSGNFTTLAVVTLNGGETRFLPVSISATAKKTTFKPDAKNAVKAKDVEGIPPLVRITRGYVAGIHRGNGTAVEFYPTTSLPGMDKLMASLFQNTGAPSTEATNN